MDSSYPIISSLNLDRRIQRQKKMCIPSDVLQLLECSIKIDDEMEDESSFPDMSVMEFPFNIELENEDQEVYFVKSIF